MEDPTDIEPDNQVETEVNTQILIDTAHAEYDLLKKEHSALVIQTGLSGMASLSTLLLASYVLIASKDDPSIASAGLALLIAGVLAGAHTFTRLQESQRKEDQISYLERKNWPKLRSRRSTTKEH